jgi:signal transduction histidine kinase
MPNRFRPFTPGPEGTILVVLVLTLALSGVLAYHAHRAAGSHRQAAEAALRDYAAFASWELERRLGDALPGTLQQAVMRARLPVDLAPLAGGSSVRVFRSAPEEAVPGIIDIVQRSGPTGPTESLDFFETVLRRDLERCGCGEAARDFFLIDLRGGDATPEPSSLPASFRRWLADVLLPEVVEEARQGLPFPAELPALDASGGGRIVQRMVGPLPAPYTVRPFDGPASRLVYTFQRDTRGGPTALYGFVLDVPALARPIIRSVVETAAFLPTSLTQGASNEEVLALRVSLAGGETLYRSSDHLPPTLVVDTLHSDLATLVTEVAIRPEMAGMLVIGGLPRSRLPLLLGLFGVTLGLVAIAAVQLRRQRTLARLRSDFVSGVSHELRTPLAQIQLFAELLGTERLRRDQRDRSVRVIKEESRRLIYLVENILRFSGTERRAAQVAPEPTEAAPLIRDIMESFAPLARAREVTLTTDLDESLHAPLDRSALRQVLLNLLDNAVKYGPRGQRVEVAARAQDGRLVVSVSDEGPGVPPAERKRIWRPYHRLHRDAESATGGSGIGLAVVRELVELHGGRVATSDGPAGGAVFEVSFPGAESRSPRAGEAAHDLGEAAE